MRSPIWTVVLPLKGGPTAKSRLKGGPELAAAIAFDSLDAVLDCPDVVRTLVVTADDTTAVAARAAGAEVTPESAPGAGLVAAIRDGVRAAAQLPGPIAVLLGDVPALRPDDLEAALRAAASALRGRGPVARTLPWGRGQAPMALVPDAEGTGTVLLAARSALHLDPAFGPGSAAEHLRRGALLLDLDLPRLRRDVDTADDLAAALALGCGPRTSLIAGPTPARA